MHIRKFQKDDYETIKKLTQDSFDGVSIDQQLENMFGLINQKNWQWRLGRQVDQDVANVPEGVFVMEEEKEILGWISSSVDHDSQIGHIPHMAVRKGFQGKGIGRKMIMHVLELFRKEGMSHVQIETLVQNQAANGLYESIGFQKAAEKIYYALDLDRLN